MNQLCLFTGLSSSDLAAWVQAIGSIAAVVGAVWIALWQSRKQHKAALDLLKAERASAKLEIAKAVQMLSTGALITLRSSNKSFPNPNALFEIAERKKFYDLGQLGVIENSILGIPLHSLPHELVRLNMIASSAVRQYHRAVQMALNKSRAMSEQDLKGFFETLHGATEELRRSGSACLNSFPRFISGLRAGCQRCRVVHGGGRRLRRTGRRGGQLGAHQGFHLTRPAPVWASRRSTPRPA